MQIFKTNLFEASSPLQSPQLTFINESPHDLQNSIQFFLQLPQTHHSPQSRQIDIRNCGQLSVFPTTQGLNILAFQVVSEEQMGAYFTSILDSCLNNQPRFMPQQLQSSQDRDEVVQTIIKLHGNLNFKVQTLHLAVAITDRFLSVKNLKKFEYEIVGVTSLWMAAKIQQTKIPHFNDWLLLGQGCLADELIQFESEILKVLDYNLNIPTALSFFHLLLSRKEIQHRAFFLCHYLLEISLSDSKYLNYKYSLILVSAYYLSLLICDRRSWNLGNISTFMKANQQQLQECAEQLLKSMINVSSSPSNEVYKKFSEECFFKISHVCFNQPKERSLSGKSTLSNNSRCSY